MYEKYASCGKLHLAKVPSVNRSFFPYCHFNDRDSSGPYLDVLFDKISRNVQLLIYGDAKLKPNIQKSPRNRIDIYMSVDTAATISQSLKKLCHESKTLGQALSETNVDPEASRAGPQTLPQIEKQYKATVSNIHGTCGGYSFSKATTIYLDHEKPDTNHVEMVGEERHLGIPFYQLSGEEDTNLISLRDVPESELRVQGERNPVKFTKLNISIIMSLEQACNFAETI